MAKKSPPPVRKPDALVKLRSEFKAFLNERIEKGKTLLATRVTTREELDALNKECGKWDSVNSEFLKHSFNNENSNYKHEYDSVNSLFGLMEAARRIQTNPIEDCKKKLQNKIDKLDELIERSDLFKSMAE